MFLHLGGISDFSSVVPAGDADLAGCTDFRKLSAKRQAAAEPSRLQISTEIHHERPLGFTMRCSRCVSLSAAAPRSRSGPRKPFARCPERRFLCERVRGKRADQEADRINTTNTIWSGEKPTKAWSSVQLPWF